MLAVSILAPSPRADMVDTIILDPDHTIVINLSSVPLYVVSELIQDGFYYGPRVRIYGLNDGEYLTLTLVTRNYNTTIAVSTYYVIALFRELLGEKLYLTIYNGTVQRYEISIDSLLVITNNLNHGIEIDLSTISAAAAEITYMLYDASNTLIAFNIASDYFCQFFTSTVYLPAGTYADGLLVADQIYVESSTVTLNVSIVKYSSIIIINNQQQDLSDRITNITHLRLFSGCPTQYILTCG